jgi:hypothetical protein
MEATNIIWITLFTIILIILNCLYPLIFTYIDEKPMGSQSIFDLVLKDHFKVARFTGTTYCVVAILSKIEVVTSFLNDHNLLAVVACSVYEFSFATVCFNIGLTCIVRTFCLMNITFVEVSILIITF